MFLLGKPDVPVAFCHETKIGSSFVNVQSKSSCFTLYQLQTDSKLQSTSCESVAKFELSSYKSNVEGVIDFKVSSAKTSLRYKKGFQADMQIH